MDWATGKELERLLHQMEQRIIGRIIIRIDALEVSVADQFAQLDTAVQDDSAKLDGLVTLLAQTDTDIKAEIERLKTLLPPDIAPQLATLSSIGDRLAAASAELTAIDTSVQPPTPPPTPAP